MKLNIIYNECCLKGMKNKIDQHSIDVICVDLPYGKIFGAKNDWESVICLKKLWEIWLYCLKKNGTIILFAKQPFTSTLVSSNYSMFKYSCVWQKSIPGGFAQAPYKFLCEHEDILIFSNCGTSKNAKMRMIYNPQNTIECNIKQKGKTGNSKHRYNRKTQKDYIQTRKNYPRSILKFANQRKNIHPTQKPIKLLEYLIETFTNPDNIVLDCCIGSGTTAIACINTNRNYIGFEINQEYYNQCIKRINNHNKQ